MAPRKKAVRRVPKVYAAASLYLNPTDCDSTISYKVIRTPRRLYCNMQLTDCNRKIEWYFPNEVGSVKKIDTVIAALQDFRKAFTDAQKASIQRRRKP